MAKRTANQSSAQDSGGRGAPAQPKPRRSTVPPPLEPDTIAAHPSEEEIRMRAYHRYLERGGGHGMDFEDWLEAERELKSSKFEV